jgi:hypothetical protein
LTNENFKDLDITSYVTFPSTFESDSVSSSQWDSVGEHDGSTLIVASISSQLTSIQSITQYILFCLRGLNRLKPSTLFVVSDISVYLNFPKKFGDCLKRRSFGNWELLDSFVVCAKPCLSSIKKVPSVANDKTMCAWLRFQYLKPLKRVAKSLSFQNSQPEDAEDEDEDEDEDAEDVDEGAQDLDSNDESDEEYNESRKEMSDQDFQVPAKRKRPVFEVNENEVSEDIDGSMSTSDTEESYQGDWAIKNYFLSNLGEKMFPGGEESFTDLGFEEKLVIFKDYPNVPFALYYITFLVESNQQFLDDCNPESLFNVAAVNLSVPVCFLTCLLPINYSMVTIVTTCQPGLENIVSTRNILVKFSENRLQDSSQLVSFLNDISQMFVSAQVFSTWSQIPDLSAQFKFALMDIPADDDVAVDDSVADDVDASDSVADVSKASNKRKVPDSALEQKDFQKIQKVSTETYIQNSIGKNIYFESKNNKLYFKKLANLVVSQFTLKSVRLF